MAVGSIEKVTPTPMVPIGAVRSERDWFWIPDGITIDSGVAESVIPKRCASNIRSKRVSSQELAYTM